MNSRLYLRGPELLVPLDLLRRVAVDAELVIVLDVVGHRDGPLAYNDVGAAAVVATRCANVPILRRRYRSVPLVVPVVVERREVRVRQVRGRVAGTPCLSLYFQISGVGYS